MYAPLLREVQHHLIFQGGQANPVIHKNHLFNYDNVIALT